MKVCRGAVCSRVSEPFALVYGVATATRRARSPGPVDTSVADKNSDEAAKDMAKNAGLPPKK